MTDDEKLALRNELLPSRLYFDSNFYLEQNPDVAAAVDAKILATAWEHFVKYGAFEGRMPNKANTACLHRWLFSQTRDGLPQLGLKQLAGLLDKKGVAFFQELEALPVWKSVNSGDRSPITDLLKLLASELGNMELIYVFAWLASNCDHSAAAELSKHLAGIGDGKILPTLFKYIDIYNMEDKNLAEFRSILFDRTINSDEFQRFIAGEFGLFFDGLVEVHAAEICARYIGNSDKALPRTAIESDGEGLTGHIFVGFFGQLRFPEETLFNLCKWLRFQMPESTLSMAVSTWETAGVRPIEPNHPGIFALEQLPYIFTEYFKNEEGVKFRDIERLFPSVAKLLRERGATNKNINKSILEDFCGCSVFSAVGSDVDFMLEAGDQISKSFPDHPHMLNQGRMWNRIAKFKELLTAAEIANGTADAVILMRPDIQINGSIYDIINDIRSNCSYNSKVFTDFDAHAKFRSGVGDRLFVMNRSASLRLFDGERVMQSALSNGGVVQNIYHWFFDMHTYPQTLLYQHGCQIKSIDLEDCNVSIYRGRLNWSQIATQAAEDAVNSPTLKAREFLKSAIADFT